MDMGREEKLRGKVWYLYTVSSRDIAQELTDFEPHSPEHEVFVQDFWSGKTLHIQLRGLRYSNEVWADHRFGIFESSHDRKLYMEVMILRVTKARSEEDMDFLFGSFGEAGEKPFVVLLRVFEIKMRSVWCVENMSRGQSLYILSESRRNSRSDH
jgi:hypothetical protein